VLRRANPTVVGEFRIRRRGDFVVPHDQRIRQWIEIPEGMAIPATERAAAHRVGAREVEVHSVEDLDGMIVNVEIVDFGEEGDRPVGRVIEILGHPDDFGVDVEILIRAHQIPHEFPDDVLEQARTIPAPIPETEIVRRRDFRSFDIVTIDGETARDFDDAVWVDRLDNGNWALHVHIADVSHYVRPGSPIDREAFRRGTSVYFPDRAVPMLPIELSTDQCSLRPHEDRLVLSVLLEIDSHGDTVKREFVRGVIRSAERMTYTAVYGVLEGDPELRERYARLVPRFEQMRELALLLNRKRQRRGSIDFDLPEALLEFDEFGEMTGVTRAPRNIAHRIIEEFMLAANEAVAAHLEEAGEPMIFRIHERPDPKRVLEFEEIAAHFGYSLTPGGVPVQKIRGEVIPLDNPNLTSRNYQRLVAKIEGKPEERILSYLMLRSLKQARYSDQNLGHFALAALSYTHFTSPIRRYPDLVVHRILAAHMDGTHYDADLRAIAEQSSETERRAAEAERELVEWKKIKFMIGRVGDEFDGLIISTTRFGFFVELQELFIEGLVPIDTLPGDRFEYRENTRKITGVRHRRQFSIGDRVRVRLDRVDGVEKKLQFGFVRFLGD
jgi:ribonuclease R